MDDIAEIVRKVENLAIGPDVVDLDASVWSNLPEHLMEMILARLPPMSMFRLRAVCKRWNTIVSSRGFLEECSRVKHRSPYFLMFADHFHRRVAAVYDREFNKWQLLPLSYFMKCRVPESFLVLAAAGGLLCLEGTGSQSNTMFVTNPIARTFRKLPQMLAMRSPYVVAMVIQSQKSYKILVVEDGEELHSQVYDSSSNSWQRTDVLHRRTAILAGATLYKGLLYSLTFSPTGLLAFDMNEGTWHTLNNITLPHSLTCPNLMTHHTKLLLIGGYEHLGTLRSVHFWYLHTKHENDNEEEEEEEEEEEVEWVEIDRVPDDYFRRLFTASSGHFICVGYGDYICLHEYHSPEILMYHISNASWHWLPTCSDIEARSVLGFAFQPRLEALP